MEAKKNKKKIIQGVKHNKIQKLTAFFKNSEKSTFLLVFLAMCASFSSLGLAIFSSFGLFMEHTGLPLDLVALVPSTYSKPLGSLLVEVTFFGLFWDPTGLPLDLETVSTVGSEISTTVEWPSKSLVIF